MGIHDPDQDPRNADRRCRDDDVEGHAVRFDENKVNLDADDVEGHAVRFDENKVNPDTYPDESTPTP